MELKRRYNCSTLLIEDFPISLGLIQSLREQSINVTTSTRLSNERKAVGEFVTTMGGSRLATSVSGVLLDRQGLYAILFPGSVQR